MMDKSLAVRLERTEGWINASFVQTLAQMRPDRGATWIETDGTYAMFAGVGSPITQTFGLGMQTAATPALLDSIEAFFFERKADVHHETSPLAGVGLFATLADRGYRPIEVSNVLVRPLDQRDAAPPLSTFIVRIASPAEAETWVDTAAEGWIELVEYASQIREMAEATARNPAVTPFFVEDAGVPVASGALGVHENVALLAGASTIPKHRGRGAQSAVLAARLQHARLLGCDIAMVATEPGSASQRNAERNGFRIAYTRIKWGLAFKG